MSLGANLESPILWEMLCKRDFNVKGNRQDYEKNWEKWKPRLGDLFTLKDNSNWKVYSTENFAIILISSNKGMVRTAHLQDGKWTDGSYQFSLKQKPNRLHISTKGKSKQILK